MGFHQRFFEPMTSVRSRSVAIRLERQQHDRGDFRYDHGDGVAPDMATVTASDGTTSASETFSWTVAPVVFAPRR